MARTHVAPSPAPVDPEIRTGWSDSDWDAALLGHPEATYFHTRRWAQIVTASFPRVKDRSLWVETREGTTLVPLFEVSRAHGLLPIVHSSFPFLYGGPVPLSANGQDRWAEILPLLRAQSRSIRITGNPFGSSPEANTVMGCGFRVLSDSTHLIELPDDIETFWRDGLSSARRNDFRRLTRKGVAIESTTSPEDIEAVYALYRSSFRRWGGRPRAPHPMEFYRNMVRMGDGEVRFTVARFEGRIVGGTFTVRHNRITHYLAGYYDADSRPLRPNVLLQIDSIQHAIAGGCRWYDLLPSGLGHASVIAFKEGLGGVRREFPIYERLSVPRRLIGFVRRRS